MIARIGRALLVLGIGVLCITATATAAEPEWRAEQPVSPGIGVPTSIGDIGGMAFWSPNKGVLITSGNGGMPAGVYAYDGSGWYLYSTVCGGGEKEGGTGGAGIAISGPDEFWTISDYAEPQENEGRTSEEIGRTLCHFASGKVVMSYAEPATSAEAFGRMEGAACSGPADCWFAGWSTPAARNGDPFHLHWDGSSLTAVPSLISVEPEVTPMPGNVESLALAQGRVIESASEAPFLREVSLENPHRFAPIEAPAAAAGPFVLSSEPRQQQLWAGNSSGSVLRLGSVGFESVDVEEPVFERSGNVIRAIGAEPGTEAAWLGGGIIGGEVRRVTADGDLGPTLPVPGQAEELDPKGAVKEIVCPAAGQCWAATSKGWLFHLGGPPAEGVNTDPLMHLLISTRPQDPSSRRGVPGGVPEDNSGEVESGRAAEPPGGRFPRPKKHRRLVVKVKRKLIQETVLQLTFTLTAKAHVQLSAKFHKVVVAKTKLLTLGKGRHTLRLRLDPKRWPTGLDFQAHPIVKRTKK